MAWRMRGKHDEQEVDVVPRHLTIGNGSMLVNFDARLNMRDLYYPYVGLWNHISGHRNAIGVWVDGRFAWLDDDGWDIDVGYERETLVTDCRAEHSGLGVRLTISGAVHFRENLYLKRLIVQNLRERAAEIRVFFTHDLSIDETDIGDTALYDLSTDCILHYKRDKCFLISGQAGRGGIYQFATGTKRFGGAEGTWRDAEDGKLEGNPISQGSVDSTISFQLQLPPGGRETISYWIAVGRGFESVRNLHGWVRTQGIEALLEETRAYWRAWVNKKSMSFYDLPPEVIDLYKRSLLIARTQIGRNGAIMASTDTDILHYNRDHYAYIWPRDGAFVAYAFDEAGYSEVTRTFFRFCSDLLSPGGFLWHKYNPDGSVGSSWHPWMRDGETHLPIQEDETAVVLFALEKHYLAVNDLEFVERLYTPLIKPAADFLAGYRDSRTGLPLDSYDLWEERRGIFTYTVCTVWAGLRAAARFAKLFGHRETSNRYRRIADEIREALLKYLYSPKHGRFLRGLYMDDRGALEPDPTIESSLSALFLFGVLPPDDPRVESTMRAIEKHLWVKGIGGIARYQKDYYFYKGRHFDEVPGNPWILCTLWLAEWYIARAKSVEDLAPAKKIMQWVTERALPSGVLSEQVHPETGGPESVAPLTWSHTTFILAVNHYLRKYHEVERRAAQATRWHMAPS